MKHFTPADCLDPEKLRQLEARFKVASAEDLERARKMLEKEATKKFKKDVFRI